MEDLELAELSCGDGKIHSRLSAEVLTDHADIEVCDCGEYAVISLTASQARELAAWLLRAVHEIET